MTSPAHAYYSASKFESIMLCPGKLALEQGLPDGANIYSSEGTAAHLVLTWALQEERPASAYLGRVIHLDHLGKPCEPVAADYTFTVDEEMAEHVQQCVDYCLDLRGDDGVLFADIRVNYSTYLEVDHDLAWGTADVIIARGEEIIVVDFKYGRGVEVDARENPQMSLYALGALQAYQGVVADFNRVRMAISQPRVSKAPSEWDCSVDDLEKWGRHRARSAACTARNAVETKPHIDAAKWEPLYLRPAEKACKFCKANATCPALRDEVAKTTFAVAPASVDEFADLAPEKPQGYSPDVDDAGWLAACLSKVDLIEDWCKAIRAEAERRLLAGEPVPGFKVVAGKRGARQWADPKEAERLLREVFRLPIEKAYDLKLISPTSAEKLAKAGDIGPRQWPKAQALITQPEGKPHVAPESDPRPALDVKPVADDFDVLA